MKSDSKVLVVTRPAPEILIATVNRPEAKNAVNFALIDALERLVESIEEDERIRVFILTGEGADSFIAGGDLKEFHTIKSKEKAVEMSKRMHSLLLRIELLPVWTICSLNGSAYGGGIEIMLAFDFRIANEHAQFGFTQGRFFLTPGWGGLTRLIEKVGKSKALQLLAESAVLDAHETMALKIIEKVERDLELADKCLEWAAKLSKNDRFYIRSIKKAANNGRLERIECLIGEIEPFTELWVHPKHEERVEKFIQKRSD